MTNSFLKIYRRSLFWKIFTWVAFLALIYFPLFLHLGSLPVALWDESLFALRALFMYDTGEYMINFNQFEGLSDHMNTKLPFTTFFQVLGLHIFGVNELGIRVPIIFVFLGLSLWIYMFFRKQFQAGWIAGLFVLLLVINYGFLGSHMLRTGNQDAPFATYLLLAVLYFWKYIEKQKMVDMLWFCFFMSAALLTKNLLAVIILPGMFAFLIINKTRFKTIMGSYKTYIAALVVLGVYVLTIAYFEWSHEGFFDRMWNYELMGRYSNTIEGHAGGFFYYFDIYFEQGSSGLSYILFFGLFVLLDKHADRRLKHLVSLLSLVFISYLILISLSATKTGWYLAPLYPFGTMIGSIGIYHFYQKYFKQTVLPVKIFIGVFFVILISENYSNVIDLVYKPEPNHREQFYGNYIKNNPEVLGKEFYIIDSNFGTAAFFAKEVYNRNKGYDITFTKKFDDVQFPAKILTCRPNEVRHIKDNFHYELIDDNSIFCRSYLLLGNNNQE